MHEGGASSTDLLAIDVAVELDCAGCSATATVAFPLVTDWRDRERIEQLRSLFPSLPCSSCGAIIATPGPVVIARPGDPIPVLFCVRDAHPTTLERLTAGLATQANEEGVIPGPVANTDPDLIGVVADRYTGFQIIGVEAPGQAWADDDRIRRWLTAMRSEHEWPDVVHAVNGYLSAGDEIDHPHAAVLDAPRWEPVVRRLAQKTANGQPSLEGERAVRARMRALGLQRYRSTGLDSETSTAQQAIALLEELTALQTSPHRSEADVRHGIEAGRALIALTTDAYGPDHPLTLTATNDTAALMLDDLSAAGEMTGEAERLLAGVRATATRTEASILADATMNLALTELRGDRVADADAAEAAIRLLWDAVHLNQLYFPDEPERALSAIGNLATLLRSRLAGDATGNVDAALALFDQARALDDGRRHLTTPDRISLESNYMSLLADRARLTPTVENDLALIAAVEALEPQLAELDARHPVRTRTLTNFGAIVVDLLQRESSSVPDDFARRAEAWLEDAHRNTVHLTVDDAARILASTTLSSLHFRLGGEARFVAAAALLTECVAALRESPPTRLHHTVLHNLAQLRLAQGDWDSAVEILEKACLDADAVIERAATPATRLAHVAAAGDLFQRLAFLYAHREDARSAVHTVERSRARWRSAALGQYDAAAVDQAVLARLAQGTALLYVGTCALGSYAVVLVPEQGAGAWTAGIATPALMPVIAKLQAARRVVDVAAALDDAARALDNGFLDHAARILRSYAVSRIAVVASGPLAALPVAALPDPAVSLAGDATVEYLIGARCAPARRHPDPTTTVAIVNPTTGPRFAAGDLSSVQRYAPSAVTPPAGAGVRGWLLDQLPHVTHLHLACHARYDPTDPFASRFVLGDNLSLTVGELAGVATPHLAMVVASCCRSGVVDQRGADELVGLAHAMIAAGAASAIAALWEIDDAGASLLIAKFYDELAAGVQPADALTAAQATIRDSTMEELTELARADNDTSWIPGQLRRELRILALHPDLSAPGSRPFAHPAHWAGLVYIGG